MQLADALRALRERWWVLLLSALLAAGVAYAYTKLPWVEPRWKSSVWLQAEGRFDYGNTLALEKQLRPLAEQVRQLNIMRDVDRNLHLDLAPERLLAYTRAEPVQDSSQIRIDVENPDATWAESIALEIAEVYTQQHNASQQAKLRAEQVMLSILARPSAATLAWPQTRVIVPAAALLGLIAAAGIVLALAYLDDSLKSANDVEEHLALPLLGQIPATTPAGRASSFAARFRPAPLRREPPQPAPATAPTAARR